MRETFEARPDGAAKAEGSALYTEDFHPTGMLYGVVVRSTVAAGKILSIDLDLARASEGVACVLGPNDVPLKRFGDAIHDEPILAQNVVKYVGEPVALVAAETLAQAREAAELVAVEYELRPAAVTLAEALAPDAPQVHPGQSNLYDPVVVRRGDVGEAFAKADFVVETTIRSQRCHQAYIELRSALAEIDPENRLVVTMPSQIPYGVRRTLARVFGLPMTKVVVRVPALGGGFGGKLHDGLAPYAAALAISTRRPTRVVGTREEELQASNPREGAIVRMISAVRHDGRILGRRSIAQLDSGAYAMDTPIIESLAALHCSGPYEIEAVEGVAQSVATNTHPTGSFRAPTGPELCFAYESHMNDIADRLDIDVIEVRRINMMRAGSKGPSGQVIHTDAMATVLERAEGAVGQWRKTAALAPAGWRRGYGIACAWYYTARGPSGAIVRLNEDGTVAVHTGATEIGTAAVVGGVRELVARIFGVTPATVDLHSGDTSAAPPDMGSEGSRTLYGAGRAAMTAATEACNAIAAAVADELEASVDDIVFRDGYVQVAGSPENRMSLAEAVAVTTRHSGPVVAGGSFMPDHWEHDPSSVEGLRVPTFHDPSFHCHAVELLVDEALGAVKVERYVAVHDTGTIIYRPGAVGQIEGGVVQGLGYALYEDVQIDHHGRTRNPNFVDYRIPTAADIPSELEVITVEDYPSDRGPNGAKGLAESPILLPAAAVGAAVHDAVGVRARELPITADRVACLLEEKKGWLQDSSKGDS